MMTSVASWIRKVRRAGGAIFRQNFDRQSQVFDGECPKLQLCP